MLAKHIYIINWMASDETAVLFTVIMSYGMIDSCHSQPRDFNNLTQTCSSNIQKITQNSEYISLT